MDLNEVTRTFMTVKQMLVDRNIDISNLENVSNTELLAMSKANLIFSLTVNENFHVVYYLHSKFKIADLKKFIPEDAHIFLIFKEKINTQNIKNIKELSNDSIEIFMLNELMFNITHHYLVPKHELCNEDEIVEIMTRYKIKQKTQLPIILKSDPMARYLDLKQGNVVKITRPSPSAGETLVYRYCV
jgi:DNA-directed RNA polymerase subunit H (RpoH/RPB5)